MQLTFATPHLSLSNVIGAYYLIEIEHILIEDAQRADVGQIRLMLQGLGHIQFSGSPPVEAAPASILGPSTVYSTAMLHGPVRILGLSLMPRAWGGLLQSQAHVFSNTAADAAPLLPKGTDALIETLRTKENILAMAPLLDAFLQPMLRPLPKGHSHVIEAIRAWLSASAFPRVEDLYASWPLSERQMTRISNRYWGGAPKALANKYGALHTALGIVQQEGSPKADAIAHYADRPHLIREVKRATGQTPRQLKSIANPLLRYSLLPENYRELQASPA